MDIDRLEAAPAEVAALARSFTAGLPIPPHHAFDGRDCHAALLLIAAAQSMVSDDARKHLNAAAWAVREGARG